MIEPAQARQLVVEHCPPPSSVLVSIDDAIGCVLAQDVATPVALPPFDNSAMDGFTLMSKDTVGATEQQPVRLELDTVIYAGDTGSPGLRPGRARAIMTGAPLPDGADTVLPREVARVDGEELLVDQPVEPGRHVRRRGEEAARGTRLLGAGQLLTVGSAAVLATAGRARVRVCRKPGVAVITTGSEAIPPGERLRRGQIFDSNTAMVSAMVRGAGLPLVRARRVKDHPSALSSAARSALQRADVVVFTGGVSVGDRDYLRAVLSRLRVREIFWRVNQKPGKPLYFGTRGKRLVFGLPGNPASAFTCFYLYVLPALQRMSGVTDPQPVAVRRVLMEPVQRDAARWRFLKAYTQGNSVTPLPGQGSHMTVSLARTNALIAVPPGEGSIAPGDGVTVYQLPVGEVTA